jgi:hypothetical protein
MDLSLSERLKYLLSQDVTWDGESIQGPTSNFGAPFTFDRVVDAKDLHLPDDHEARMLNVNLNVVFSAVWSFFDSIAGGALLDTFLFVLANESNKGQSALIHVIVSIFLPYSSL